MQKDKSGKDSTDSKKYLIFAAAGGSALLLLGAVLFLIIRKKKVKDEPAEETSIEALVSQVQEQQADAREDGTVIAAVRPSGCLDETVAVFWNSEAAYHLVLRDVKAPAKSIEFPLKGTATIGRKPGVNDIVFENDRTVSARHCEVAVRDGRYYITDLKSSNGTYVNGRKVVTEMEVFSGDLLRLGNLELKFEIK